VVDTDRSWGSSLASDLIVVLLAGVALLTPVFARDILMIGPEGFGLLRASFGVGALVMALYLGRFPILRRGGVWMFGAVAVFGLCTLVFGLSKVAWLSALVLFIGGAADMISVNIRQTLIQIATPDHMRGRVSSVSMLFIGASNELGEAYSGVMVRLLGPVGAAVFGGAAALGATGLWAKLFPGLRKADRLGVGREPTFRPARRASGPGRSSCRSSGSPRPRPPRYSRWPATAGR